MGATVRAYVVPPLCGEAEQQLQRAGGRAGDVRLEAVCLPSVRSKGRLDLTTVGANARRSTEDSTAVAYLEAPGKAGSFSHPILQTAEIPWIVTSSGKQAMAQLLRAVESADTSGSLRAAVASELE